MCMAQFFGILGLYLAFGIFCINVRIKFLIIASVSKIETMQELYFDSDFCILMQKSGLPKMENVQAMAHNNIAKSLFRNLQIFTF